MCNSIGCCPDITAIGDIVKDEICGTFNIPCQKEAQPVTVWELDLVAFNSGAQASASITIFYEQGCDNSLSAVITNEEGTSKTLEVPKLNSRSYTSFNPVRLQLLCEAKDDKSPLKFCRGKYCISLHYDVLESRF